jgi:hypothetical protein
MTPSVSVGDDTDDSTFASNRERSQAYPR